MRVGCEMSVGMGSGFGLRLSGFGVSTSDLGFYAILKT
jgi:hypothetical protein